MELAPKNTGLSTARLERITEHLERNYIQPGKIAGAQVAVSRHGHLAYFHSFGQMDRERNRPMADDTIFRIYSMSKPITSVALMMLYERGYFQLNDPVSRFFPSWKDHRVFVSGPFENMQTVAPNRPVSMRDMLCHTGGLTYGAALESLGAPETKDAVADAYKAHGVRRGKGETLEEFMEKLAKVPLAYQPGERWLYSLSTDVCGALVERISGKRFDRYLQEEIFEPLGMKDTAFTVAADKQSRFAANYRRGADKGLHLVDDPTTSDYLQEQTFFSGGGGLTGTTEDYLRFCEMLRRGGEFEGRGADHGLSPGGLEGPLPGPAPALDTAYRQGLQADQAGRRLLARRPEERPAAAHLRHELGLRGGPRGLYQARRGGREARPPQARRGHGPVPHPGRGPGDDLLASQGLDPLPHPAGLHAPPAGERRL